MLSVSRKEIGIILGAKLMYCSVPFVRVAKTELNSADHVALDALQERLFQSRQSDADINMIEISSHDIDLIEHVLSSCLMECNDSIIDLDIHLNVRDKSLVEILLEKIRRCKQ